MGSAGKQDVWKKIWQEVQFTGQVPPISWTARAMRASTALVSRQYRALVKDGVLQKPHGRGSYKLMMTPDGEHLVYGLGRADSPRGHFRPYDFDPS